MRRSINWLAAVAWLATGMVVAFLLMSRFAPQMHQRAVAAPAATGEQPSAAPPPATQCDARALSQMYVNVASKLKPSVVTIQIEKKAEGGPQMGPLDDFFRQFHGGRGMRGMRPQIERGLGSGFVIDRTGNILTNNHVVDGADRVTVVASDGRKWTGKVVGTDPKDDLAVVKVDKLDLPPVAMGDSDKLQVGELVMAIGSPFGLDQTVTVGVVSARGRRLDGTPYAFEDFIQTDAAINHGNSGGPLVNMNGEVVGVNSRIAGEGTGIGFSVSGNVAKRVSQALIKDGRVRRPYIGVQLQPLTPDMAPQFKADKGVLVNNVLDGSPASKAGIKIGDVIVAIDGKPVLRSDEVVHGVQAHNVGQQVKVTVLRDGAKRDLAMTTAEAPDEKPGKEARFSGGGGDDAPRGKYGIKLADLTPDVARELGVQTKKGAVVEAVEPGSPADHSGLSDGDVIVEIDRRPVAGAGEVVGALKNGGTHLLRIDSAQAGPHFVTLSPEK
jgi:Do/DeqQ family serine protease